METQTVSIVVSEKQRRANLICRLYKQFYSETITIDAIAAKIAAESKLGLKPNSIKSMLSTFRKGGWKAPKCTRAPRNSSTSNDVELSFEELNAQWGK